jgi:hypothetical protein
MFESHGNLPAVGENAATIEKSRNFIAGFMNIVGAEITINPAASLAVSIASQVYRLFADKADGNAILAFPSRK